MLRTKCWSCFEHKQCANVMDIGWLCLDCREIAGPPVHIQEKEEKILQTKGMGETKDVT